MRRDLLLLSLVGAALLAAAGEGQPPQRGRGHGDLRGLFVSPAGEPFRVTPGGPAPLAAWFAGADTNHDGSLSFAEFRADFRRYFAVLDTNHDGEIAPDEVAHYESEILPEISAHSGSGAGVSAGGVARYGLIPIPHPIWSADDDFNRGVSVMEFDHAAMSRFNLLDERHVGRLSLEQLEARRTLMLGTRFEDPINRPPPPEPMQPPPDGQ